MTDDNDGVVNLNLVRSRLGDGALREAAPPADRGSPPPEDPLRRDGLPPACPVVALGVNDGRFFYLDAMRQMREIPASRFDGKNIAAMFAGRTDMLTTLWPRIDKNGNPLGWQSRIAMEQLMDAAARVGVWDPWDRVRGPGAWRGDSDELILHVGDRILSFPPGADPWGDRVERPSGALAGKVYPAAARGPAPAETPAGAGDGSPGQTLYDALLTWPWKRGAIDATLALGWLGASMIGGALAWRPAAWITGGAGTGKSTLQKILDEILGGGAISVSDATAAGIWQALGYSSLPIKFDELEAEEDNRRARQILDLMRQATSGGLILRGGSDHGARSFKANGAFLASSILMPPMRRADHSRIAVLELGLLEKGSKPPAKTPAEWRLIGQALRRRLVDGWGRWDDLVGRYRLRLAETGHDARGCDLYGSLLAASHTLISDAPDIFEAWCEGVSPEKMLVDGAADEGNMIQHLLTTSIVPFAGGEKFTLATWVRRGAGFDGEWSAAAAGNTSAKANKILGVHGLKIEWVPSVKAGEKAEPFLAIANNHRGLAAVFDGTQWGTRSGASAVWVQAARRLAGAEWPDKTIWFGGAGSRATLVPARSVVPMLDADEPALNQD